MGGSNPLRICKSLVSNHASNVPSIILMHAVKIRCHNLTSRFRFFFNEIWLQWITFKAIATSDSYKSGWLEIKCLVLSESLSFRNEYSQWKNTVENSVASASLAQNLHYIWCLQTIDWRNIDVCFGIDFHSLLLLARVTLRCVCACVGVRVRGSACACAIWLVFLWIRGIETFSPVDSCQISQIFSRYRV